MVAAPGQSATIAEHVSETRTKALPAIGPEGGLLRWWAFAITFARSNSVEAAPLNRSRAVAAIFCGAKAPSKAASIASLNRPSLALDRAIIQINDIYENGFGPVRWPT